MSLESGPPPKRPKVHQATLFAHFTPKSKPSVVTNDVDAPSSEGLLVQNDATTSQLENERDCEPCTATCCSDRDMMQKPNQPSDPKFIARISQRQQGNRKRYFNQSWFKSFPWLTLCNTTGKVYCCYCRSMSHAGKLYEVGEQAFISVGFDNWKKAGEKFGTHDRSRLHHEALMKLTFSQQPDVRTMIDTRSKADQAQRRSMLVKQLSSLRYLLQQGLAIRGHDECDGNLYQLLHLRSEDSQQLASWLQDRSYLSPVIINEQISLLGQVISRKLLEEVREAGIFSILADEASDLSHREQLCLCIRWVDNDFEIHEDFLELIEAPKTDANTITMLLKDSLVRHCLPISNCRGQGYDGASTFRGHINGVAAQIESIEPAALYVHCFAHCTNLCLQTAARQCATIRDALDLVMEMSQLIRFSPKRLSLFETLQSQLSTASPSLKPLCPTRWTVRTTAFDSVLQNYATLCDALSQINTECADEYGRKAGGYLAQMDKFSTFFGLKLSMLVFASCEQLSLTLQGKDTLVQDAVYAATVTRQHLNNLRSEEKFNSFYESVVSSSTNLTNPPVLPRFRRPPRQPCDGSTPAHRFATPQDYFRKQYYEVLDIVTGQLEQRFKQAKGMPVAEKIESILLKAANGECCSLPDLQQHLDLYKKDFDFAQLHVQLQMLPSLLQARNQKRAGEPPIRCATKVRTCADVLNDTEMGKALFPQVVALLKLYFTLPVTTATAERSFSALRRLKNYLRTSMKQTRLNSAMLLHVHKERCKDIDITALAKAFCEVNDRRQQFFGSF